MGSMECSERELVPWLALDCSRLLDHTVQDQCAGKA